MVTMTMMMRWVTCRLSILCEDLASGNVVPSRIVGMFCFGETRRLSVEPVDPPPPLAQPIAYEWRQQSPSLPFAVVACRS